MNEQTQTLEWIKATAESTTLFVETQAPLYAQEVINYTIFSSILGVLVFTVLMVGFLKLGRKLLSKAKEDNWNSTEYMFGSIISFVISFVMGISTLCSFDSLIKCFLAPRIIIIEHISKLLQ